MPLILPSGTYSDHVNFLFYNFVGALMVDGLLDRRVGALLVIDLVGKDMKSRVTAQNTTVLAEAGRPTAGVPHPGQRVFLGS